MADPGTCCATVDEERLGEWLRERRWFGAKAAEMSHFGVLDVVPLRPGAVAGARRGALQLRRPRPLPAAGRRPRRGADRRRRLRRADRSDRGGRARRADAGVRRDRRRRGHRALPLDGRAAGPVDADAVGAPDGRRAVQLDDRARRRAGAEGVPAPAARRQPRARDAALPVRRTASRTSPTLAGWYEFSGERMEATLGVLQRFVADGRDGVGVRARRAGGVPRARRASSAR